jgi:hypothetical protein
MKYMHKHVLKKLTHLAILNCSYGYDPSGLGKKTEDFAK